jgi:hypothetical protein
MQIFLLLVPDISFQRLLLFSRLLSGTDEGIFDILRLIGELTDCTRCSIYEVQGTPKIVKRKLFWTKSGADGEKTYSTIPI